METDILTLDEFLSYCRQSLKYLEEFGFKEVTPPPHRRNNPFELWLKADKRTVIVEGSGWGKFASIELEHDDGFELAVVYLLPEDHLPKRQKKRKTNPSQREQVSRLARLLQEHGRDFLEGDLKRFFKYAGPLPPYKLPE